MARPVQGGRSGALADRRTRRRILRARRNRPEARIAHVDAVLGLEAATADHQNRDFGRTNDLCILRLGVVTGQIAEERRRRSAQRCRAKLDPVTSLGRKTVNHSKTQTWLVVLGTVLVWCLIGWILLSLRGATLTAQLPASTRVLAVLCAGASLLLLLIVVLACLRLLRIAADSERESRFPPESASQYGIATRLEGEAAWMMAARLRGWGVLALAAGILIAGCGFGIALRSANLLAEPTLRFAPMPAPDLPAERQLIPDRSTGARG